MLLLLVFLAVAVLAAVVLGAVVHGLLGAAGRLRRETAALQSDVAPVAAQLQSAAEAAAAARRHPSDA